MKTYGDEHYAEVAAVYRETLRSGEWVGTNVKISQVFGVTNTTAARWVAIARRRGFLASVQEEVRGGAACQNEIISASRRKHLREKEWRLRVGDVRLAAFGLANDPPTLSQMLVLDLAFSGGIR